MSKLTSTHGVMKFDVFKQTTALVDDVKKLRASVDGVESAAEAPEGNAQREMSKVADSSLINVSGLLELLSAMDDVGVDWKIFEQMNLDDIRQLSSLFIGMLSYRALDSHPRAFVTEKAAIKECLSHIQQSIKDITGLREKSRHLLSQMTESDLSNKDEILKVQKRFAEYYRQANRRQESCVTYASHMNDIVDKIVVSTQWRINTGYVIRDIVVGVLIVTGIFGFLYYILGYGGGWGTSGRRGAAGYLGSVLMAAVVAVWHTTDTARLQRVHDDLKDYRTRRAMLMTRVDDLNDAMDSMQDAIEEAAAELITEAGPSPATTPPEHTSGAASRSRVPVRVTQPARRSVRRTPNKTSPPTEI